jgi:hypothetical protein
MDFEQLLRQLLELAGVDPLSLDLSDFRQPSSRTPIVGRTTSGILEGSRDIPPRGAIGPRETSGILQQATAPARPGPQMLELLPGFSIPIFNPGRPQMPTRDTSSPSEMFIRDLVRRSLGSKSFGIAP